MHDNIWKRFWSKVNMGLPDECWEWQAKLARGYGRFYIEHITIAAHRLSWIMLRGPIPDGILVLHKCDNRKCVNPNHLYLGTHSDNNSDRAQRNSNNQGGPISRFSSKDIEDVKDLIKKGKHKLFIANKYNISLNHVYTLTSK